MAKPDPYGDIDFEEINDATGLAPDEIKCLKVQGPDTGEQHKGGGGYAIKFVQGGS